MLCWIYGLYDGTWRKWYNWRRATTLRRQKTSHWIEKDREWKLPIYTPIVKSSDPAISFLPLWPQSRTSCTESAREAELAVKETRFDTIIKCRQEIYMATSHRKHTTRAKPWIIGNFSYVATIVCDWGYDEEDDGSERQWVATGRAQLKQLLLRGIQRWSMQYDIKNLCVQVPSQDGCV